MGALTDKEKALMVRLRSPEFCGVDDAIALIERLAGRLDVLGSRCERYLSALQSVRAAITENATDTIWLRNEDAANMTAVECIDAALQSPTGNQTPENLGVRMAPREAAKHLDSCSNYPPECSDDCPVYLEWLAAQPTPTDSPTTKSVVASSSLVDAPTESTAPMCGAYSQGLGAPCDLPSGHSGLHESAGDAFHQTTLAQDVSIKPEKSDMGASEADAWRKWFEDSGNADFWNNVECVECELGRECSDHPTGTTPTSEDDVCPVCDGGPGNFCVCTCPSSPKEDKR